MFLFLTSALLSYSGLYFLAFRLNAGIQSERGKIRTKITPNTDTFRAVWVCWVFFECPSSKNICNITRNRLAHGSIEFFKKSPKYIFCITLIADCFLGNKMCTFSPCSVSQIKLFTWRHLRWSLFLTVHRSKVFSCEFCEIFKKQLFYKTLVNGYFWK